MPAQSTSNVVRLVADHGEGAAEQNGARDHQSLTQGCRDHLIHGATTAFAEGLADAQEDLLDLADRATKLEMQHLYLVGQRLLSTRGQELLQRFREQFVEVFQRTLESSSQSEPSATRLPSTSELGLVDCDDFERDLAIGKLASRAAYNCSQQLTALDRRLAVVLRVPRLRQEENPLHPRSLFTAFLNAVQAMEVDRELDLILLQQFEQQTARKLPGIYSHINRYLVEKDVLPTIPVGADEPAARDGQQADGPSSQGGQSSAANGTAPQQWPQTTGPADQAALGASHSPPETPTGSSEDTFARLLAGLQALGLSGPAQQRHAGSAPSASQGQLLNALTGLQRGETSKGGPTANGAAPLAADSIGLLHQIRATPMPGWSQPMDAGTLDLVAMLFDLIFDDPDVPPQLRAEIAKLQVPVLKVALMDKSFFSQKKHPARRLLDTIAGAAVGWAEDALPRLLAKVKGVVDTIVKDFETDISLFTAQTERLAEFLADEEQRGRDKLAAARGTEESSNAPQFVDKVVAEQIARRTSDGHLPRPVADFLDRVWRAVLIRTARVPGQDDRAWDQALATMDELIWSVAPKSSHGERQKLLAALPGLLERLREGVVAVDKEGEWSEFYSALMDYHMRALRAPSDSAEPAPPRDAGAPHRTGPDAPTVTPAPKRAAHTEASPPAPADDASEDSHLRLARSLALGTWVEFRSERGKRKTLRLSWVSGMRGVYLFTNRQGQNGLTIAVARLADYFRRGTARVVSEERLTERALAQMLDKTQGGSQE